jgi:UDP-N-acetylglucosamine 4,6-dehydratase
MCGGELFVPKIPSMNIMDLTAAIAPGCKTKVIGIRPGEKLHELMIPKDEARKTVEYEKFFVIQPDFRFWQRRCTWNGGRPVAEDFEFRSDNNPWRLSMDEMKVMIKEL